MAIKIGRSNAGKKATSRYFLSPFRRRFAYIGIFSVALLINVLLTSRVRTSDGDPHRAQARLTSVLRFITDELPKPAQGRGILDENPKPAQGRGIFDELPNPAQGRGRRLTQLDESTPLRGKQKNGAPFRILDTRFFERALEDCGNDRKCFLARVPVHPSRNCSQAVYGSHHRTGSALADSLQRVLPCSGNAIYDHMVRDDYKYGRPVLHFIRDPLEVVVSGYQYHLVSDDSWLETSGYKKRLQTKSLEKGLDIEYRGTAMWNVENSLGVYELMKHNQTAQQDFFTIRIDQVRDERMFNLTTQAIQVWLGIDEPISWKDLQACCYRPNHVDNLEEKPMLRQKIMDQHAVEICELRKKLDFPVVGLEDWVRPSPKQHCGEILSRLLVAGLLGVVSLLVSACFVGIFSRLASAFLRWKRSKSVDVMIGSKATEATDQTKKEERVPASCSLVTRFCYELSWQAPLFALHDPFLCGGGAELDIQQIFSPRPIWLTRIIRLGLLLWSLQIFWIDMHLFRFPRFYFAFFSQITFGLTIGYYFVAACTAFSGPLRQPKTRVHHRGSRPSLWVCLHWAYFAAIVTCQFIVTTVHWSTNVRFFLHVLPRKQRYPSVMKHGVFFVLTLWEGLVYSCIPLRAKLLGFPLTILTLYAAWTFFQSHYGPSNPFFYGQDHDWTGYPDDDDAVYPQFNWHKRPAESSLNTVYGFVLVPFHFLVLWVVSAWWGGCQWDGSHRRYVLSSFAAVRDATTNDDDDDVEEEEDIELEGLLFRRSDEVAYRGR